MTKTTSLLAFALLIFGQVASGATPDPKFLPEEQADFAGAGNFLCQEALGLRFALPPPGFKANQGHQAKLVQTLQEPGPSAYGWVWLNEEKGQLILIEMVKGPKTAEDFRFFTEKVADGFGKATSFELVSQKSETEKLPFHFKLSALLKEGNAFDIACVSTLANHPDPAVACMVTFAPDHQELEKIRDSLSFGGCK